MHKLKPDQWALGLLISNIAVLAFLAGGYALAYLLAYFLPITIPALQLIPGLIIAGSAIAINTLIAAVVGLRPCKFNPLQQSEPTEASVSMLPPLFSATLALGGGFFALAFFGNFTLMSAAIIGGIGAGAAFVSSCVLTLSKLSIEKVGQGIYFLGKTIKNALPDTDLINLDRKHTGLAIILSNVAALTFTAAGLALTWVTSTLFNFPFPPINWIAGCIIAGSVIAANSVITWLNGFEEKSPDLPNSSSSHISVPFIPAMVTATLAVLSCTLGIPFLAGESLLASVKVAGIAAGLTVMASTGLYLAKTVVSAFIYGGEKLYDFGYGKFTGVMIQRQKSQMREQMREHQWQQQELPPGPPHDQYGHSIN